MAERVPTIETESQRQRSRSRERNRCVELMSWLVPPEGLHKELKQFAELELERLSLTKFGSPAVEAPIVVDAATKAGPPAVAAADAPGSVAPPHVPSVREWVDRLRDSVQLRIDGQRW